MCVTCSCGMPMNDHGDPRNIVLADIQAAADAADLALQEAADNIPRTIRAATRSGYPQSIADALKRPTLVCDIDGVLAMMPQALCGALNARYGLALTPDSITRFGMENTLTPEQGAWLLTLFNDPLLYENLCPDTRAIDVINDAHEDGFTVVIATNRPAECGDATNDWLDRYNVQRDATYVLSGDKVAWMERFNPTNPAVLIDDSPDIQRDATRPGVQVWTPKLAYTPDDTPAWVFDDWFEARQKLGLS